MIIDLGKLVVPSPGTPVAVSTLIRPIGKTHQACHGILVQALPTNVGRVYVGSRQLNKVTGNGIFGFLAIPTANNIPSFSASITIAPNGLAVETFYLDADVGGEGAIVTVVVT